MKIFINPGHCPGIDPGAVNVSKGIHEADVVLQIGNMVKTLLEGSGYEVKLLQANSLEEICDVANEWSADYFVSIHCNACESHQGTGTETFCYAFGTEAAKFAASIQRKIVAKLGMIDRGVREASYQVLRCTDMPAVLIECGFIDNNDDVVKLINNQGDFADAIYRGIIDFVEE